MTKNNNSEPFLMHGCRKILEITAGAIQIESHVKAIETSLVDSPGIVFDLSKALIETTCKTILKDKKQNINEGDDLPHIFRETIRQLPIGATEEVTSGETRESIRKTLNGLNTVVGGLCELRNNLGTVSHGRDAYQKRSDIVNAQFAARIADSVTHFLFMIHKNYFNGPSRSLVAYEDYKEFNESIDGSHDLVKILELSYKSSEVLFLVDKLAYFNALTEFREEPTNEDEGHS